MSRFVLFNAAVLVRPGAATKIDASQFENVNLGGLGVVGLVGAAEGGPPGLGVYRSFAAVKDAYLSGNLVEGAAVVTDPSNDERVPAGAQTIVCYKLNASTRSSLTKAPHVFKSKDYGVHTNLVTMTLAADLVTPDANARKVTIETTGPDGILVQEISPFLGTAAAGGKFTIIYTGAGTPATMTITATQLTTACTGAVGDNLSLLFADYPNLAALLAAINATGKYTATALIANAATFDPTYLDAVAAQNILILYTAYARNFDLLDWINNNSSIVFDDAAAYTKGAAGPIAVFTKTAFTGGLRGAIVQADWATAFTTLGSLQINELVPLASTDAEAATSGGSVSSLMITFRDHCKLMSGTAGRHERQGYAGVAGTKAQLITQLNALNSPHVCLVGQKPRRVKVETALLAYLPEWAGACLLAGMRAGAPLGEPLTWKFPNCQGVSSDASWDETDNDDCVDLELNGLVVFNTVANKGVRIDKGITTYTASDNDAYTEETIVQIWKNVGYTLRTGLENRYTGRGGTLDQLRTVPIYVDHTLGPFEEAGALTASKLANGKELAAWRDISARLSGDKLYVGVTITPTPGINFILNTIVLTPAQISV